MFSPRKLLLILTHQATKSQSLPAKLTPTQALRMMVADRILVAVVVIAEDPRLPEMKAKTAVMKRRKRWLLEMITTAIVVVAAIAGEAALVAAAVTVTVITTTAEVVVAEVVAIVEIVVIVEIVEIVATVMIAAPEKTEVLPNMILTVVPCSVA